MNSTPKELAEKQREEEAKHFLPTDFDKNMAQYISSNITLLSKKLEGEAIQKKFQAGSQQDLVKKDIDEIEDNFLMREIKFPRAINIEEIKDSGEKDKWNIGEITLEKVSPMEVNTKDLLPPESIETLKMPTQPKTPQPRLNALPPRQQFQPPRQLKGRPLLPPRPLALNMRRPTTVSITPPPKARHSVYPSVMEKLTIFGLAKFDSLLDDPKVQTIECPGPDKPVLVYKDGIIQATKMIFTAEEIEKIMKEISDKTRIPITTGVFKAALHRFIVTAVISEFVGTRFIIQKKASV